MVIHNNAIQNIHEQLPNIVSTYKYPICRKLVKYEFPLQNETKHGTENRKRRLL